MHMGIPHYVGADVCSDYTVQWLIYYTLHRYMEILSYWCRIHLWFRWLGVCRQSRWRHTEPNRPRWRVCVTMATLWQQQDGGYMLLWKRYGNNKMAAMRYYQFTIDAYACSFYVNCKKTIITRSVYTSNSKSTVWTCYRCILHLEQYSHRLNLFFSWITQILNSIICIISYNEFRPRNEQ